MGEIPARDEQPLSDPQRDRVLGLLKRYGRQATSFQILEPELAYWFDGEDAVVAYSDLGDAWVTAGEPICAPERVHEVVARFLKAAESAGRRARFFHVSEAFSGARELARTHVGELPLWDPAQWEATLKGSKNLREQLRRARSKGVTTRELSSEEITDPTRPVRQQCDALSSRWLHGRGMSELKFMVRLYLYGYPQERRYLVAEREGRVVGLAVAIPVYQRNGWFIEDLLRDESSPNGTAELLVDAAMRSFQRSGSHYATLGLAPLAGEVRPLLALTRNYTTGLYNFPGVRSFKDKLRPRQWEPVYLAYPRAEFGLLAMRDVLAAFAPGGLLRFGLSTLVHQRSLATLLLAVFLVPWTIALGVMNTEVWFPSANIQYAWVAFDVLLIVLMLSLVQRWRTHVADQVVVLTTLDAFLTTFQVLFWNMWTTHGWFHWSLVCLGCAGPLLAATFFWSARRVAMRGRSLRV